MRLDHRSVVVAKYNAVDVVVTRSVSWELCGGGRSWGAFHFFHFFVHCLVMYYSVCGLDWLNKLVVFPWGVDMITGHTLHNIFVCSESDSSKRSVSTPQNSLYLSSWPKAAFLPSSTIFFYTGNTHWRGWKQQFSGGVEQSAQVEMEGFAAFTTLDMACGRMIILLRLSCFHDRGKPKSKLKLKFN